MAGMAPPPVEAEEEETNVSPEEQEAYEDFVAAGYALLYLDGEVRPGILKLLDEDPADLMKVLGSVEELQEFSPVVAIAATTTMIVLEIMRHAGEEKPEGYIAFHGAQALCEDIVQIYESAFKADLSEDDVNKAFLMAVDLYREVGEVDEGALAAEFEQIVAADKQGKLGEVLPELERINQLAEQNMAEGEEPNEPAS